MGSVAHGRRDFVRTLLAVPTLGFGSTTMKIKQAAVYHLEVPIKQAVKTSFGAMTARHLVLLELVDEQGHTGFGESWTNFPAWAPLERVAAFKTAFLPYLNGKEVADVPSFVLTMAKTFLGPALQSGTMGPLVSALCAVDMALIELAAKRKNLPIRRLLFGDSGQRVKIYGSGINAPIPWTLIDHYLERGVGLFKLKLGFSDDDDLRNIQALKKHLGSAKLAVDVNRNWTFQQAAGWLGKLADYEIAWLEEPLRVEEEPRLRELASLSRVPIAGGENILVAPGSDTSAIAAAPVAVLQPDMTKYCTTHDFLRLLPEANKNGKRVVPHLLGSAPGQAFSLHLAAGCPERLVEWDINPNPLHTDLFVEPLTISSGAIDIPDRPGLGWTPKLNRKDRAA